MFGVCPRAVMPSTTRTTPSGVSNSVSSTIVPSRYPRRRQRTAPRGPSSQRPCSGVPSSAAKQAAESTRGTQNQSIEPSQPTRAAVSSSAMSA
jgi:hypothetical protein